MNSSVNYQPSTGFSLLLVGPPLSGKTSLAMQFPGPWIASTDRKINNALPRIQQGKAWFYDYPGLDPQGKPLLDHQKWARLIEVTKAAAASPDVKTLIWDHLTDISDWLQYHIIQVGDSKLTVGGMKVMNQAMWQPFKHMMAKAITAIKEAGKMFIVIAHDHVDKDEVSGQLIYRPLIGGRLRDTLDSYFTDVWRCEVEPGFRDKPPTFRVLTQPTAKMNLTSSIGLPASFEADWSTIANALQTTH